MSLILKLKRFVLQHFDKRVVDILRLIRAQILKNKIFVEVYRIILGLDKPHHPNKFGSDEIDYFIPDNTVWNIDEIVKAIKDPAIKIVSIDVFDTLIFRSLARPDDIHKVISDDFGFAEYHQLRIDAENEARRRCKTEEITFEDITNLIPDKYIECFKQEIEYEKKFLNPTRLCGEIFNICKTYNKKIVLVSDMYLSSKTISDILRQKGIAGYEHLFVSSEYGLCKGTGNLFKFVLENLKIKKEQICHIGDNQHSDYLVPKRLGIRAIRIASPFERMLKNPDYEWLCRAYLDSRKTLQESAILGQNMLANELQIGSGFLNRIGFALGGPLCLSYTSFIHDVAIKQKADALIFVARDGYSLRYCFDYIYSDIRTYYLYANRRLYINNTGDFGKSKEREKIFNNDYSRWRKERIASGSGFNEVSTEDYIRGNGNCYEKYIANSNLTGSRLLDIDMTSISFSGHNLLSKFISNRIIGSIYSIIPADKPKFDYYEFATSGFSTDLYPIISLSELLISAPEKTVFAINPDGSPMRLAGETSYEKIFEGIKLFIETYKNSFNNFVLYGSFDDWARCAAYYFQYASDKDLQQFKSIEIDDLDGSKNFADIIERWRVARGLG